MLTHDGDNYHHTTQHRKVYAEPHELERHERGAFRDHEDSRYFTMHPKRKEYREETDHRRYEHLKEHEDYHAVEKALQYERHLEDH